MPLRILHCLRAPVGGLFRHVRDLAEEQARRGHAVGVVCDAVAADPLTEGRLVELQPHLALGLRRVAMSRELGPADIAAYAAIRDLALPGRYDVIHGHGAKGGAYARLAAHSAKRRGRDIAALYTPHGGSLHYHPRSLKGRVYMGLERWLAGMTDAIVFESAYSARLYTAQVTACGPAMRVIPNGVQPAEFAAVPPAPDAADLLFVGELRHLKGVDVLLRALRQVRDTRPVTAVIVGAGPDADHFRTLAAELGLGPSVRFAGAMPVRQAFALGRCLVMPSRAESFPYVVLEAGAAALPLLASDVGGIPEIVEGTDTALLPPGDVAALAAAIRDVMDRPEAAAARARRLRDRIAARFTVDTMTTAILDVYAGCRQPRPASPDAGPRRAAALHHS